MPCGICQVALDDDLTILYANRFYYDIYGYTPQNAEEQGFINVRFILPEEEYPEIHRKVLDYAGAGTTKFQMEFRESTVLEKFYGCWSSAPIIRIRLSIYSVL